MSVCLCTCTCNIHGTYLYNVHATFLLADGKVDAVTFSTGTGGTLAGLCVCVCMCVCCICVCACVCVCVCDVCVCVCVCVHV